MVPTGGLEPPRLTPPPPQDGVSTNSTTSAIFFVRLSNADPTLNFFFTDSARPGHRRVLLVCSAGVTAQVRLFSSRAARRAGGGAGGPAAGGGGGAGGPAPQ